MSSMTSARYEKNGPATEVLHIVEVPRPEPGKGEARVRLVLSPIHNHDVITIAGGYGVTPSLPAGAGSEALGIVDAIGEGVTSLKPGDRVIAAGLTAAWSDYYIAQAVRLVRVPDSLPDELAAQMAGMPFDALLAFNAIAAEKGDWLIVNAANGAVGKAIIQIANSRGVKVVGLVHSEAGKTDLAQMGLGNVFVTSDKAWPDAVRTLIGSSRVAGGLDMVGGEVVNEMIKLMSQGAKLLVLGAMSNQPIRLDAAPVIFHELEVKGFWAAKAASRLTPTQIRMVIENVITLAADGRLSLPVAETYPLSEIKAATAAMDEKRNGKILLRRG